MDTGTEIPGTDDFRQRVSAASGLEPVRLEDDDWLIEVVLFVERHDLIAEAARLYGLRRLRAVLADMADSGAVFPATVGRLTRLLDRIAAQHPDLDDDPALRVDAGDVPPPPQPGGGLPNHNGGGLG